MKKFSNLISENIDTNITDEPDEAIFLSRSEIKLLMMCLHDLCNYRSDQGCNDPNPEEEELFTQSERDSIIKFLGDDTPHRMSNYNYPAYILTKIQTQTGISV